MNIKKKIWIFSISFFVLLLSSCGQKGVDKPLNLNGVKLQIVDAEFRDEIIIGNQKFTAKSPNTNTLLYVKAETTASLGELDDERWTIELEDGSGNLYSPSMRGKSSTESEQKSNLEWAFVVENYQDVFLLRINDTEIILDSFIPELSEADKIKATAVQANKAISQIQLLNCYQTIYIPVDKEVEIYHVQQCESKVQADEFIQAAQFDVSLDGVTIQLENGESFEIEEGGYLALFTKNIGNLAPGKHTIKTNVTFSSVVLSNGLEYGPGTKRENLNGTCDLVIN